MGIHMTQHLQHTLCGNQFSLGILDFTLAGLLPACFFVMAACSVPLHRRLLWTDYGNLHVQEGRLRNAMIAQSTLSGLLKLNFYFVFSYIVQIVPSSLLDYDISVLEITLVFAMWTLFSLFALIAIESEKATLLACFVVVHVLWTAYFVFRFTAFVIPRTSFDPYKVIFILSLCLVLKSVI